MQQRILLSILQNVVVLEMLELLKLFLMVLNAIDVIWIKGGLRNRYKMGVEGIEIKGWL